MQLVKVLKAGVDVDGDGAADLSTSRIYYAGQSFGGIYGVQLLGLEPDIRAGVPNVPGGPIIEIARLSPCVPAARRDRADHAGAVALQRGAESRRSTSFIENMPLRNLPLVVDTVPGASAIQEPDRQHRVGAAGGATRRRTRRSSRGR